MEILYLTKILQILFQVPKKNIVTTAYGQEELTKKIKSSEIT